VVMVSKPPSMGSDIETNHYCLLWIYHRRLMRATITPEIYSKVPFSITAYSTGRLG
jgi:hypothetical protein